MKQIKVGKQLNIKNTSLIDKQKFENKKVKRELKKK